MRSGGPVAIAARSDPARTASRSAGCPVRRRAARRDGPTGSSVTATQASAGDRWAARIISAAVSNGQARPTGLNGSCRLSPPAATTTPASRSAFTAVSPRGHRLLVIATLQIEVRRREGDDRDPRRGEGFGHLALALDALDAEADAVTGGDRAVEAGRRHDVGELGETVRRRVEGLVGVQVDADAERIGDREQGLGRRPDRPVLEVRAAADEIGTPRDRLAQEGPLVGPLRSGDRPAAQGDDLDVDQIDDASAHLDERLHAEQAVVDGGVDVRADEPEAVGRHQPGGPLGPFDGVGEIDRRAGRDHRVDRAEQVAALVGQALGEERLVEVGVRLGRGREEEPAVELDNGVRGSPAGRRRRRR